MPSLNKLLAVGAMGMGAAAMSIALYIATTPRAFTSATAAPARPAVTLTPSSPVEVEPSPAFIELEPVEIIGTVRQRKGAAPAAAPAPLQPCSEWSALASGPADRRVRHLCPDRS